MNLSKKYKKLLLLAAVSSIAFPSAATFAVDAFAEEAVGFNNTSTDEDTESFPATEECTETDLPTKENAEDSTPAKEGTDDVVSVSSDSATEIKDNSETPKTKVLSSGIEKTEDNKKDKAITTDAPIKSSEPKKTEKSGWIFTDGSWYYYKSNKPYTGWHYMSSGEGEKTPHWSFFGNDGRLYTGWHYMSAKEGEKTPHWSFFGDNGWLRTGWVMFGKGTSEPDGNSAVHWSYFGDNGWLRTEWQKMGAGTSNPDGNAAAHFSYFGDNGWLKTGWIREGNGIEGLRYLDESGWLLGALGYKTDWQKIGRVYYRFDENGVMNGANMPDYEIYDQMSNYFYGACGPSASFHAACATGGLSGYTKDLNGYKKFIWDFYGMPYGTNDKHSKGVYTVGSSIVQLSNFLKKGGVDATYAPNRQYTAEEVKDALTHGQAVVPLMHVWYVGSNTAYFSQHYVAVTGWRKEGDSLQFYTADSYKNANTGWTDINKDGKKTSAYGYNKYTGYNESLGKAPAPRTGIGYSMKVGSYIHLP